MKIQFVSLGGISHPSLLCLKLFLKVAKSCARGFTGREMRTSANWCELAICTIGKSYLWLYCYKKASRDNIILCTLYSIIEALNFNFKPRKCDNFSENDYIFCMKFYIFSSLVCSCLTALILLFCVRSVCFLCCANT